MFVKYNKIVVYFPRNTRVPWECLGTYDNSCIDQCKEKNPDAQM